MNSVILLRELAGTRDCCTPEDLAAATRRPVPEVERAIAALHRRRLIEGVRGRCYRASPAGRAAAKAAIKAAERTAAARRARAHDARPDRKDSFRGKVWRALRASGKATIDQLLALALSAPARMSPDALAAAHSHAGAYLRALAAAGYVAIMRQRERGTAPTSPGFKRYMLLPGHNSGPRAPHVNVDGRVYDPNLQKVTYDPLRQPPPGAAKARPWR